MLPVCLVFTCRVVLSLALIPPWQQADEASHLAVAELQANRFRQAVVADPAREHDILLSMARYKWWFHRDGPDGTPVQIPTRFVAAGWRVAIDPNTITEPSVYYRITGRVFSLLPQYSVLSDLYGLRVLSALFGILTIWLGWLATRECVGAGAATVVAALMSLHPEFLLVSTTASPDSAVALLGACAWWQTAVAVRRELLWPLVAVWCAALVAAATDRAGAPLLALALVVTPVVLVPRLPFRGWRAYAVGLMTLAAAAVFGALAFFAAASFQNSFNLAAMSVEWADAATTWDFFVHFSTYFHQSWWLAVGWRPYLPSPWWTAVAISITVVATAGLVRQFATRADIDVRGRVLLGLAVLAQCIQLAAVYWVFFRLARGGQGRSMFPVLVPALFALYIGTASWFPPSRRAHVAVALIIVFALLDAAAWALVALPAYNASL
jgi:hypothetical protein